jgi:hypothetical protein
VTSRDRHLPEKRRAGLYQQTEPEPLVREDAVRDPGTEPGEADRATGGQDEGDQGEWWGPGQPDRAGWTGQRDDNDEYEPL